MSGLVEQLQSDALDSNISITNLLRKAKVVAVKLGTADISEWIEKEMSGYKIDDSVPGYRDIPCVLKYMYIATGEWVDIVGSDRMIKNYQPIHEIESLCASGDSFQIDIDPDYYRSLSSKIGYSCGGIKRFPHTQSIRGIIEFVRNAVLDWSLKLDQAGIHGEGMSFTPVETIQAKSVVYNFNIGSIENAHGLGTSGDNASIITAHSVDNRSYVEQVCKLVEEVDKRLTELPEEIQEETKALLTEIKTISQAQKPDVSRLKQCIKILGGVMEKVSAGLITHGITHYIQNLPM